MATEEINDSIRVGFSEELRHGAKIRVIGVAAGVATPSIA
jgi:hypothetical protein